MLILSLITLKEDIRTIWQPLKEEKGTKFSFFVTEKGSEGKQKRSNWIKLSLPTPFQDCLLCCETCWPSYSVIWFQDFWTMYQCFTLIFRSTHNAHRKCVGNVWWSRLKKIHFEIWRQFYVVAFNLLFFSWPNYRAIQYLHCTLHCASINIITRSAEQCLTDQIIIYSHRPQLDWRKLDQWWLNKLSCRRWKWWEKVKVSS